jgi:hypothetical protein
VAFDRERIRWTMAAFAAMFAAYTLASVVEHEDVATIISSSVATVVFAGLWYFVGWLQHR